MGRPAAEPGLPVFCMHGGAARTGQGAPSVPMSFIAMDKFHTRCLPEQPLPSLFPARVGWTVCTHTFPLPPTATTGLIVAPLMHLGHLGNGLE